MLSLVLSGSLFGTGGLLGSLLGRAAGLAPVAVAAYRLAAGSVLIIIFLALTGGLRRLPRGRAGLARVAGVGTLAAAAQGSYFAAVASTSVTLATLLTIGSMPVLVLLAERLTGRRTGRRMLVSLPLALAGLGLLVGVPSDGSGVLAGAGLALLAAAAFAALTVLGARPVAGMSELATIGFGFAVGGSLLAVVAGFGLTFEVTGASVGLLVALAVLPTAVAYPLYFRGSRTVGAGTAAVLTLLEPLTGALLAAALLGDRLGAAGIAGAALLCAAMVLAAGVRLRGYP
ncbi:MAG TPA: DMT family transporter [Actinophytocola sp.]|uniref:DMT family transporter n=1 Tax=Actinophytocola sp. TaxID=1872138 RepID=UPI002DDCEE1D|nr:DMT family transporter [Actinophytocola sp.]HEV2779313.1 DMT family transporter [Actinophytocola sp.]